MDEIILVEDKTWGDDFYEEDDSHEGEDETGSIMDNYPSAAEVGLNINKTYIPYPDKKGDTLSIRDGKIKGRYTKRLNLEKIHKEILKNISKSQSEIPKLREQLREMDRRLIEEQMSGTEINALIRDKKKIKEKISNLDGDALRKKYIQKSQKYVDAYRNLDLESEEVDFFDQDKITERDIEAQTIIDSFLHVASDYVEVNVVQDIKRSSLCFDCGYDLSEATPEAGGTFDCPGCGVQINYFNKESIREMENNGTKGARNNYEDRLNFIKAFACYQGKSEPKLPDDIYERLDAYFIKYGMDNGETIRETYEKDEFGRKKNTSLNMMLTALSMVGLSKNYKDSRLIMHRYWGWDLPNVEHLKDKILKDYDRSQAVFLEIKDPNRKSCLNVQYRLFRHLQRLGHKCEASDFKIIATTRTFRLHESYWEKICKRLHTEEDPWVFKSII